MELFQQHFLQILRGLLHNRPEEIPDSLSPDDWQKLFSLGQIHKVFPMVYEAACMKGALQNHPMLASTRRFALQQVMEQTVKTTEFLRLYESLSITPLVVKGIVCRSLYPKGDMRPSSDEDLLILPNAFSDCRARLHELGMVSAENGNPKEISFRKPGSPLHIELHSSLFPDDQVYSIMNQVFEGIFDRAMTMEVEGIRLSVPDHTDHLLYLICHSYKHFIHSGFGIRQVCDIMLYAQAWGHLVDWPRIIESCRLVRADIFAAALFRIGVNHLGFNADALHIPADWREMDLCELPLLEDILQAGVYGGSTEARQHSSTITLEAAGAAMHGSTVKRALASALFPSAAQLRNRYPYLRKHPWLLPVAWCSRIISYKKGSAVSVEALQTGSGRLKLLEQYHII